MSWGRSNGRPRRPRIPAGSARGRRAGGATARMSPPSCAADLAGSEGTDRQREYVATRRRGGDPQSATMSARAVPRFCEASSPVYRPARNLRLVRVAQSSDAARCPGDAPSRSSAAGCGAHPAAAPGGQRSGATCLCPARPRAGSPVPHLTLPVSSAEPAARFRPRAQQAG